MSAARAPLDDAPTVAGLAVRHVDTGTAPAPPPATPVEATVARPLDDEAEVWGALVLGVRDYVAKNGFSSVVLGVSGGIDSAVCAAIAADAAQLGATELCVQGLLPSTEDPAAYLAIARTAKDAAPGIHLHAYRPQDVRDLAERGGLGPDGALAALRDAGVDTVPGTGVKVLSERVRRLVAPGDLVGPPVVLCSVVSASYRESVPTSCALDGYQERGAFGPMRVLVAGPAAPGTNR